MSVPLPTSTPTDRVLTRLERERKDEADAHVAVWGFLWTLFVFKIATVGIIWWAAAGTGEDLSFIVATTWYWLVVPIGAVTGPILIRWRMIKLRRRREALRRSEWMTDATGTHQPDIRIVHLPVDPLDGGRTG